MTCTVCGYSQQRRPETARAVRDLVLVCHRRDRAGKRPPMVGPPGWRVFTRLGVAGVCEIELGDRTVVPVLPALLSVLK